MTNSLEVFTKSDVINHFGESELLQEMGYSEEYCFETNLDLKEYVIENSSDLEIELAPYFNYMVDKDRYDRFVKLLEKDKFGFELDEFLDKYD